MAAYPSNMDHPLAPICGAWNEKIRLAIDHKKAKFQEDADECMNFFNGPHDFAFAPKFARNSSGLAVGSNDDDVPDPTFRMTVNRVAEMVQLFGPVLYHKNPQRQVNPRKWPTPPIELLGDPQNPMVQQAFMAINQQVEQGRAMDKARAGLLEYYLNYTPNELNLKDESRMAIDECIIKGMGCLWTEVYQPKGTGVSMVGSFYDSVDNLFLDPDAEQLKDAMWIARRCIHPVWEIEQEYGLEPNSLRGHLESYGAQSVIASQADGDYNRKRGLTNDLLIYYKIYSRMGIGARLAGRPGGLSYDLDKARSTLDTFGDYCYLVIVPNCPYPLNLSPEILQTAGADEEILQRLEWPTPFWADDDWPMTPISFHKIPRQIWPMSHLKPAMGEIKFLNWIYSFVAGKIRNTCRDFLVVKKAASEEIKSIILEGKDLTLIEIDSQYKTISEVVQFLQHPQMNGDIWKVVEAIEHNFEKRVGLTELVYGMSSTQMRSAEEAGVKSTQIQVRPDDMASKVEEAMTTVARKEAIAARFHVKPQDVMPVLGQMGAQLWGQLVSSADIYEVVHQLEYRIEAGSTRKPNKERDASNMKQAMQTLFQPILQYAMGTMDFTAINKLIADWAKSIDLDPTGYLFKPPPPPPMPPPGAPPQNAAPPAHTPNGAPQRQPAPAR